MIVQRARYHLWGTTSSWLTIGMADTWQEVWTVIEKDRRPDDSLLAWSGWSTPSELDWDVDGILWGPDGREAYRVLTVNDPDYHQAELTWGLYTDASTRFSRS